MQGGMLAACFALAWIFLHTEATSITEWPLNFPIKVEDPSANGEAIPVVDPPFHSAGFLTLNDTHDGELFYFYFQERSKDPDAPLVFWTNGGPGCSSVNGLFYENGPYVIQEDLTLRYSEYGWDQGANILFVEQPVGTGFSRSSDDADYARYEDAVGENMLMFFLKFMEIHPELREKDLFLSGESYAGHYLPAIAKAIYDANKSGNFVHLSLKGVFVGNPWTAPLAQSLSYATFGAAHGLITQEFADRCLENSELCKEQTVACNENFDADVCLSAARTCDDVLLGQILEKNRDISVYDIRKRKYEPEAIHAEYLIEKFLNSPAIQEQLGVHAKWKDCSTKVWEYMISDIMIDMTNVVADLVNEGIGFLVYVGDQDLVCNWFGQKMWLDSLEWDKADQWTGVLSEWKVKTNSRGLIGAGDCETVLPLSLCTIHGSGHYVPRDQPEVAYNMMMTFIAGGSFLPQTSSTQPKTQTFAIS